MLDPPPFVFLGSIWLGVLRMDDVVAMLFVFLIGLAVGSFLGAVTYRLPRRISVVSPPSACPECQQRLTFTDLIPVLSYVRSRGRCRHCGVPVPWRYLAIELATACGFLGANALATVAGWPTVAAAAVLLAIMVVMAVIDLEHMLLPDKVNVLGAAAGLGFALTGVGPVSPLEALLGAGVGFGVILLIVVLSRGGMGMGDAKFLAMIGTWVGPFGALYTLFGASAIGAAVGGTLIWLGRHGRKTPMPFGPFLAVATLGVWTYLVLTG